MPFTLAHPAAVLPLVRRPLVASALVAGAVAPDLLYLDPIYRFATQGINGNFTLTSRTSCRQASGWTRSWL
ncbi:DUF4184 family protein [Kribbella sp. NPDC050281]|uniref:DUF4184 family protein n=1 Tax=Kribbella sp. NPDC050281 TaxID=3155515 RepID=UPI0033DC81EF